MTCQKKSCSQPNLSESILVTVVQGLGLGQDDHGLRPEGDRAAKVTQRREEDTEKSEFTGWGGQGLERGAAELQWLDLLHITI